MHHKIGLNTRWIVWRLGGFALALHLVTSAQAQYACPPGYAPIGGGQDAGGFHGCAPIGGGEEPEGNPAPEPIWDTRWGALAVANGAFGFSESQNSEQMAVREALKQCRASGGVNCETAIVYHDQCVAIAWGSNGCATWRGPSLEQAKKDAVAACAAKYKSCAIYYSGCSYPVRIQ